MLEINLLPVVLGCPTNHVSTWMESKLDLTVPPIPPPPHTMHKHNVMRNFGFPRLICSATQHIPASRSVWEPPHLPATFQLASATLGQSPPDSVEQGRGTRAPKPCSNSSFPQRPSCPSVGGREGTLKLQFALAHPRKVKRKGLLSSSSWSGVRG